jgi:uncharacterized protein (DUF488 family)
MTSARTVWTIGHSSRSLPELVATLAPYGIEAIADVRRFPGSRRHPQFSQPALPDALQAQGLDYVWLPSLGGRRRPAPDSINVAWRNESFRGYADHLASDEFAAGLDELVNLACGLRTAMMCSELLWWRCHRSLIADVLTVLGFEVIHILAENESARHPMTPPARIIHGKLVYVE